MTNDVLSSGHLWTTISIYGLVDYVHLLSWLCPTNHVDTCWELTPWRDFCCHIAVGIVPLLSHSSLYTVAVVTLLSHCFSVMKLLSHCGYCHIVVILVTMLSYFCHSCHIAVIAFTFLLPLLHCRHYLYIAVTFFCRHIAVTVIIFF